MIRQLPQSRLRVGVVFTLLACLACAPAFAQRVVDRPAAPQSQPRPPANAKPAASFSSTIRTADGLRELQSRVQNVVQVAQPATVAIISRLGMGSGVIVNKEGLILTAGHVAREGGFELRIVLADGRTVRGRVLGVNRSVDAAMIQITNRGEYPFVELANSSELKLGQWTVAMGHPGGYRRDRPPVVRLGRIMYLDSEMIVSSNTLVGGDSGGPLFDLDGRVIGIHSRIGESNTANIHVPSSQFTQDWDRLLKGDVWGTMPTPGGTSMLGVFTTDHPKGALVQAVLPDSTSDDAGIKAKDIITAFNGTRIRNHDHLVELLMKHKSGEEVRLDILRGEEKLQIKVELSAGQ